MKTYARFDSAPSPREGTVVEVLYDPMDIGGTEYPIDQCFTAEFLTWLREAPEGTLVGDTYVAATDTWSHPAPPEEGA